MLNKKTLLLIPAVIAALFLLDAPRAEAGCDSAQGYDANTWQSCNTDTDHAGAYTTGCYGRCGPACNWSWLGNVYTNACQTHDWCVRDSLARGYSQWGAHANCVGALGNAARSWYSHAWHTWYGKIRDKVTGFISNWL